MSPNSKFGSGVLEKKTLYSLSTILLEALTGGIYLYSRKHKKLLFHNHEFESMTGIAPAELKRSGLEPFNALVVPADLNLIRNTVYPYIVDLLRKKKGSEFSIYKYSLNYRIIHASGRQRHLFHQSTILEYLENDEPEIVLAHISDISEYKKDAAMILRISAFDVHRKKWKLLAEERFLHKPQKLSSRETDIMKLIVSGISLHEIAKKLHISYFTVRAHCRHILEKTTCRSIKDLKQKCHEEGWA